MKFTRSLNLLLTLVLLLGSASGAAARTAKAPPAPDGIVAPPAPSAPPDQVATAQGALGDDETPANALTQDVTALAAGGGHTCALTSGGGVKCWGNNWYGQLGDGTNDVSYVPVDVSGLTSGVVALAAGEHHTCALTSEGGIKCWGHNVSGKLGDGTTTERYTPVDVSGLTSGVTAIVAGWNHTCALTSGGRAKCWGDNYYGQLGDGTTRDRHTPVDVSGLTSSVIAIAAGYDHICALTSGGGAKCWGYNASGQLGDGTTTSRLTPVDVSGLTSGVMALAIGMSHTCALTSGGGIKCWGGNWYGQMGDGTDVQRLTPVDVSGLTSSVIAITAGWSHTCALTGGGGAKCWGRNYFGQLGDGTTTDRHTPVDVSGLTSSIMALAAGYEHTCALIGGGTVKCWGNNSFGQLGDGMGAIRYVPADVSGLTSNVIALAAGTGHTCALTGGGAAKCWGNNILGQLGDGTTTHRLTPVDVSGLTNNVIALAAGEYHTCALTGEGGIKCWGRNHAGQLGDGTTTDRLTPVDVSGLTSGVTALAAGYSHTCALTSGGGIKCWGWNYAGQLGDGTTTHRLTPVDVSGLTSGVMALAAGEYHTCALTTGGGIKCWGGNYAGQLGDGTTTHRLTPVDVSGLTSNVMALAAGGEHTCALTSGGGAKCWGRNDLLGDDTTTYRHTPVDVSGLTSNVIALAARGYHTCALLDGGGIKCWGYNHSGQLGDGTTLYRLTPVDVSGLTSSAIAIAAGSACTCALTGGGGIKCWGNYGQVGDGIPFYRTTPVDVIGLIDAYAITGRVSDGSGNPFAGVQIAAGAKVTATTGADGAYVLDGLLPGTYTLTTRAAGHVFRPAARAVSLPPDAGGQNFVILPGAVSTTLPLSGTASLPTLLTYTDTQGLTTTLYFPAGAFTQTTTLTLTPTLAQSGGGLAFAGHAFEVGAFPDGPLLAGRTLKLPTRITIHYSAQDTRVVSDEGQLALLWWTGSAWQDAAATCDPPSLYERDLARRVLSLPVCRLGRLSLFGPTHQTYLPLALRND